jgi:hypothetical protein
MLSCFGGGGGYSDSRSVAACDRLMLFLEVVLFQLRLSFLRKDEPDEGVPGSSGLECCVGVSVFAALLIVCALGPVNFGALCSLTLSEAVNSPLVVDRGMSAKSPPLFGSDDETYGDTACRGGRLDIAMGIVGGTTPVSRIEVEPLRR